MASLFGEVPLAAGENCLPQQWPDDRDEPLGDAPAAWFEQRPRPPFVIHIYQAYVQFSLQRPSAKFDIEAAKHRSRTRYGTLFGIDAGAHRARQFLYKISGLVDK